MVSRRSTYNVLKAQIKPLVLQSCDDVEHTPSLIVDYDTLFVDLGLGLALTTLYGWLYDPAMLHT